MKSKIGTWKWIVFSIAVALCLCASVANAQTGTLVTGTFKGPTGGTCAALSIRTVTVGGTAMCGELVFTPYDSAGRRVIRLIYGGITYFPQPAKAWVRASDNVLMSYDPVLNTVSAGIRLIPNINSTPTGTVYRLEGKLYESTDGFIPEGPFIEEKVVPDQASVDWGTIAPAGIQALTYLGYNTIQEDGASVAARNILNFIGTASSCVDNPGASRTDCTITGGGGSLTVREVDGAPSIVGAGVLEFLQTNGFVVTDQTGGVARISLTLTDANIPDTITLTNLTQITTRNYSDLQGIPSTFAPVAHALVGADHTAAGLAIGSVLRATSATAFAFGAVDLAATDAVTGVLPDANVANNITLDNLTQITTRAIGDTTGDLAASRVDDGGAAATQALFSGAAGAAGFRAIAAGDFPANYIDATTDFAAALCGTGEILEDQGASWACIPTPAGGGAHNMLSTTHTDSTAAAVARGGLIVGKTATPKWELLVLGGAATFLRSDGSDALWSAISDADVPNNITIDLAAAATALAADPADCPANQYAISIAASGALGCAQVNFSQLGGALALGQTPLTTLGDILYVNVTPALARLAGNITTTKQFLTQTGTGAVSAAPAWGTIAAGDLPSGFIDATTDFAGALCGTGEILEDQGASWACIPTPAGGGAHNMLSTTHTDSTAAAVARGGLITGIGATPKWELRAHPAAAGRYLKTDANEVIWSSGSASGTGSCTNQFVRGLNSDAAPTCETVADADVVDTITASNYLPLAGGMLTGALTLSDGAGDSPKLSFAAQTGVAFDIFMADADDDLRIELSSVFTQQVEFENIGTGVMDVLVETADGVLTSLKDGAHIVSGTIADARLGANVSLLGQTIGTAEIENNAVDDTKLRDAAATSVVGRSAGTSGDPADIAASADGQVLRRGAGTLAFGAVDLADTDAVTGVLPDANVSDTITASNYLLLAGGTLTGTLTLRAGATGAGTAPAKFQPGSLMTAAEAHAFEWDGTNLFVTQATGPTRKQLVYTSLTISTTAPLLGGGDLSANRTFSIDLFGSAAGTKVVSTSLGGDPTTDNCVKWIAGGKLGDAGAACGTGGTGDSVSVNGTAATDANFINTTATGTVPAATWSLNTTPSPDEISLTIGPASATEAGVVTTGTQTFAGIKTFGSIIPTAIGGIYIVTSSTSGADFCAKVQTGINAVVDGWVNARSLEGASVCAGTFTVPRGTTVLAGNWLLTPNSTVTVHEGAALIGMETSSAPDSGKATIFLAKNGLDAPVIACTNAVGASEWCHWSTIQNIRVEGNSAGQTVRTIATAPTGASRTSNVTTITTTVAHGFATGEQSLVRGVTDVTFNGAFEITATPTTTTFTYDNAGADATSGGGTTNAKDADCIQINRPGENFLLDNVLVSDCRHSGIRVTQNMAGSNKIGRASVHGSGIGLNYWQVSSTSIADIIKGDGNGIFMAVSLLGGAGGANIYVGKLQGESVGGDNDPFVLHDGRNSGAILRFGLVAPPGGPSHTDIFKCIGGNGCAISAQDVSVGSNYVNLVKDESFPLGTKILSVADATTSPAGGERAFNWRFGGFGQLATHTKTISISPLNQLSLDASLIIINSAPGNFSIGGLGDVNQVQCGQNCIPDGTTQWIYNDTANDMCFLHQAAGSIDVTRIITKSGDTVCTGPKSLAHFVYEKASNKRWHLLNEPYSTTTATAETSVRRNANADVSTRTFISTATTGTPPFTTSSATTATGLSADRLDGLDSATTATANTIASRDSIGNLAASTFTSTATGAPFIASTTTTAFGGVLNHTFQHSCSGTDRLLEVSVVYSHVPISTTSVSTLTYNGDALTFIRRSAEGGANVSVETWYRIAPDTGGAFDIVITFNTTLNIEGFAAARCLNDARQSSQPDIDNGAVGATTAPTVAVTTVANGVLVLDGLGWFSSGGGATPGAGQTEQFDLAGNFRNAAGSSEEKATPGSVTMSWTVDDATGWALNAVGYAGIRAPFVVNSPNNVPNLNASSLSGATFAAPGTIGGTTPGAAIFTTLTISGAISFPDGVRQTFNPDGTAPGLNVGANAGDPSTPSNGDIWYNSTSNKFRCRENAATLDCIEAGGSGDNISVNGVAAADADFDDATPAAPASAVNVKWQKDAGTPNNVSAHLLLTEIDGAGIGVSGTELVTASSEAGFLASGALTCGAGTAGKVQIHTTPLQYCDNAATPALQYAAYGDASGNALAGDSATSFFSTGTLEDARLSVNVSLLNQTIGTTELENDAVTYAKLQNVSATSRFLGRITAGAGDAEELTGTQATTLLDVFTAALKGLAPASGGGTTNFLRADGTWTAPPGGSGCTTSGSNNQVLTDTGAGGCASEANLTFDGTILTVSGRAIITQGTITADAPGISHTVTWNEGATIFTAMKMNVTDTASAAGSLLLDLQLGAARRLSLTKAGELTLGAPGTANLNFDRFGTITATIQSSNIAVGDLVFMTNTGVQTANFYDGKARIGTGPTTCSVATLCVDGVININPGTTPANALLVDIAQPGVAGTRDSHDFRIRGTSFDTAGHNADWLAFVDVTSNAGASTYTLQSRIDAAAFATRLSITDGGVLNVTSYQQGGAALNFSHLAGTATDAQLASNYSGVGGCTNQFARTLNDNAAPTCASVSLTADVSGILPGANGGTNNGFMDFTGPATTLKTFTLPNASATILTTNAAVTVAQGGSGATTLTGLLQGNGTAAFTTITDSSTVGQTLRVTGASAYGWGALDLADADAVTGLLPDGNIAATITRDSEWPSATATLTNKTLDVEATGNVITTVQYVILIAAACQNATATLLWDTPTSSPAVAACITGTNTQKGVADFADAANLSMQATLPLPRDWTGAVDARFKWLTTATTGDVVWQLATICVADAETDDPAFNTASTVTDTAKGTANQTNDADITGVTMTGCAAGELLHLKLSRDSAHASDTLAATARLISLELTLRRAQ